MEKEMLKQALDDCIINFDRRVLVTDLLQEYRLPYSEVNDVLKAYIAKKEEGGTKFEKRFLVSGEEAETTNEIYTVVKGETLLQEWLSKLKNSESALYSVEVAGGAKAAADIFKPMTWCQAQIHNIEMRPPLNWAGATNGSCNGDAKPAPKVEAKKKTFDFGVKKSTPDSTSTNKNVADKDTKKASPETKKSSPVKKQTTPEEPKSSAKPINKKGIASFFAPSSSTSKAESKKATEVIKPPTPKKIENFFKKSEKAATTSKAAKEEKSSVPENTIVSKSEKAASTPKAVKKEKAAVAANTSLQLFCTEEDEKKETEQKSHTIVDVDTSDDEAQLEELRRKCTEKDREEADTSITSTKKRRRIIDSDDEEPEVKHEKKSGTEPENSIEIDDNVEAGKSETFLDEDGFVITIKSKKSAVTKKAVKSKTPEKSPPKQETTKKQKKVSPKQNSKTKQGNIMSFFSKK